MSEYGRGIFSSVGQSLAAKIAAVMAGPGTWEERSRKVQALQAADLRDRITQNSAIDQPSAQAATPNALNPVGAIEPIDPMVALRNQNASDLANWKAGLPKGSIIDNPDGTFSYDPAAEWRQAQKQEADARNANWNAAEKAWAQQGPINPMLTLNKLNPTPGMVASLGSQKYRFTKAGWTTHDDSLPDERPEQQDFQRPVTPRVRTGISGRLDGPIGATATGDDGFRYRKTMVGWVEA